MPINFNIPPYSFNLPWFMYDIDNKQLITSKTIPGNMVVGVYRPDFAVRMLDASVAAGIEAPLRFYITENADGTATLTYRKPSAVFAPYGVPALDEMAKELDAIFAKIAADAKG